MPSLAWYVSEFGRLRAPELLAGSFARRAPRGHCGLAFIPYLSTVFDQCNLNPMEIEF